MSAPVVSRFAPSPTGFSHLGGARTALFAWLSARAAGGAFLLRIEDTDIERSEQRYTEIIIETLAWLGLSHDAPIIYQSQRADLHRSACEDLIAAGAAYWCACSPERLEDMRTGQKQRGEPLRYDGRCRSLGLAAGAGRTVRLRVPNDAARGFHDLVYGEIEVPEDRLGDLVIWRSNDTPVYNLSAAVDDADMGVTHVVRGEDHLLNTLPQLMIMRALAEARGGEWRPPQYAHLPMVLAEGSSRRLSKRDGAPGVLQLRDAGVLPEAVLGAVARLGFAAPDGVDPCSLDELVGCFDLARVQSSSAHWDGKHLMHLNAQLIQRMDIAELLERLRPRLSEAACLDGRLAALVDLLRPRAQTLVELAGQVEQHFNPPAVELDEAGRAVVRALAEHLGALDDWSEAAIDAVIHRLIDELQLPGMAAIGKPMRSALCGSPAGAPVAMLACILGREVSLERLSGAA